LTPPQSPWYGIVNGGEIHQGDILEACRIFLPPADLDEHAPTIPTFQWLEQDVIVLSQTCDMVEGREKIADILLCAIWQRSELTHGFLSTAKGMEEARRGNLPGFHVLAACDLPGCSRDVRVVDFRRVYSLPLAFFRRRATAAGDRLRLLPPYREHLAQAFARFFMRVGLPVDIPPFR
jgi:hypothetical protein